MGSFKAEKRPDPPEHLNEMERWLWRGAVRILFSNGKTGKSPLDKLDAVIASTNWSDDAGPIRADGQS